MAVLLSYNKYIRQLNTNGRTFYYADETGDTGFGQVLIRRTDSGYDVHLKPKVAGGNLPSPSYCVGWIQIEEIKASILEGKLRSEWKDAWGHQKMPDEPKWSAIDSYPTGLKNRVYEKFLSIVLATDVQLWAYYFDKVGVVLAALSEGFSILDSLSANEVADIFENYLDIRTGWALAGTGVEILRPAANRGVFFYDKKWESRTQHIEEGFRRACESQQFDTLEIFGKAVVSNKEIHFEDSAGSPCIWVAEFVAREIAKMFTKRHRSFALRELAHKFAAFKPGDGTKLSHCVQCDTSDGRSLLYDVKADSIHLIFGSNSQPQFIL